MLYASAKLGCAANRRLIRPLYVITLVMTIGGNGEPVSPPCVSRTVGAAAQTYSSSSASGIGRIRWSFINGASESATSNAFRPARVKT